MTLLRQGSPAGIVTTARRGADSADYPIKSCLVLLKPDYSLEPSHGRDTLGMRGTASEGFILRARAAADRDLADPYGQSSTADDMAPHAHLAWGLGMGGGDRPAGHGRAQAFCATRLRHRDGIRRPAAPPPRPSRSGGRFAGPWRPPCHSHQRGCPITRESCCLDSVDYPHDSSASRSECGHHGDVAADYPGYQVIPISIGRHL